MKTKAIIEYGAMDLTARGDSTLTASNIQSFSSANNLKSEPPEIKYSTFEKNFFVLDGSCTSMPANVGNLGFWSLARTGDAKEFATPITLTINFTKNHTSVGLTLRFSQYAYCTHLKIQYYNSSNTLLLEKEFYPDQYEYFCEGEAVNYRKIIITFYSTSEANRYLKIYGIAYGRTIVFEGNNLISADMVEEIDPLSNELSINTIDFVCFATDDSFNILNPTGVYQAFQRTQPIKAYMDRDGQVTDMGTFYLESWENESEKSMRMTGIDAIGILDKVEFKGGIYEDMPATTLIGTILSTANIENYITSGITSETITGYLPISSCREALQQILFVIGAIADCSRSEAINIYKLSPATTPKEIGKDAIIKGSKKITQGEIVTGASVMTHTFKLKREVETLYEESLSAGTYRVNFDRPAANLAIENGTITESGVNYAIITATGSGSQASSKYYGNRNVQITGNIYDDLTSTITVTDGELHDKTNIVSVESCTLINSSNGAAIATRILDYYQNLYENQFEMILTNEKVGENVITEKSDVNKLNGYITKLETNMTGGFTANANIIANVSEV